MCFNIFDIGYNIISNNTDVVNNKVIYNVSEEKLTSLNKPSEIVIENSKINPVIWVCVGIVILSFVTYVFILKSKILRKSKVFTIKK